MPPRIEPEDMLGGLQGCSSRLAHAQSPWPPPQRPAREDDHAEFIIDETFAVPEGVSECRHEPSSRVAQTHHKARSSRELEASEGDQ